MIKKYILKYKFRNYNIILTCGTTSAIMAELSEDKLRSSELILTESMLGAWPWERWFPKLDPRLEPSFPGLNGQLIIPVLPKLGKNSVKNKGWVSWKLILYKTLKEEVNVIQWYKSLHSNFTTLMTLLLSPNMKVPFIRCTNYYNVLRWTL